MFRALIAYPQQAPQKRHLVYCVRMSVGCGTIAVKLHYTDNFNVFPYTRVFIASFPAKINVLQNLHCCLKSKRVKFENCLIIILIL
jgi:hypothetical protein